MTKNTPLSHVCSEGGACCCPGPAVYHPVVHHSPLLVIPMVHRSLPFVVTHCSSSLSCVVPSLLFMLLFPSPVVSHVFLKVDASQGNVLASVWVVFKGPVDWTEKMTESGPNPTECNRTVGCGCPRSRAVRLPVASILKYLKTVRKPVAISCNRSFVPTNNYVFHVLKYSNYLYIMTKRGKPPD